MSPGLVNSVTSWTVSQLSKIPAHHYLDVVNLLVDVTNTFDRGPAGTVFPMSRAATMGYTYGHKKFGLGEGECEDVCCQIAPDCADGPDEKERIYLCKIRIIANNTHWLPTHSPILMLSKPAKVSILSQKRAQKYLISQY